MKISGAFLDMNKDLYWAVDICPTTLVVTGVEANPVVGLARKNGKEVRFQLHNIRFKSIECEGKRMDIFLRLKQLGRNFNNNAVLATDTVLKFLNLEKKGWE